MWQYEIKKKKNFKAIVERKAWKFRWESAFPAMEMDILCSYYDTKPTKTVMPQDKKKYI